MTKLTSTLALGVFLLAFGACSDDDGSNVVPKGPPGAGSGGGGAGGSGPSDAGPGGTAGSAGTAGSGGAAGSTGCVPVYPDAGVEPSDAGLEDAGEADGGGDASTDAGELGPIGRVSFAADVQPLFAANCAPCHVSLNSGGHNVGGPLPDSFDDAVEVGERLVQRIDGGGMPPSCNGSPGTAGCLSVRQVALVQAWLDQCLPP